MSISDVVTVDVPEKVSLPSKTQDASFTVSNFAMMVAPYADALTSLIASNDVTSPPVRRRRRNTV